MSQNIAVINYQMGNLFSIEKKIKGLGLTPIIALQKEDLLKADKIILPGVGHFGKAMKNLRDLELFDELNKAVLIDKKPVLGICLGMQLMTKNSEEGDVQGLGWIDATVKKFQVKDRLKHKIPHMGWNTAKVQKESPLFQNIADSSEFYFVHSYYVHCKNERDILTSTIYEQMFTSSFQKDNIFGVQYHPEKSHDVGNQMFENFINL